MRVFLFAICLLLPQSSDWHSPSTACGLLADFPGLKTRGYKDYGEGVGYGCSSRYKEIGKGSPANNLAYYVTGDESSAHELKLVLNVNNAAYADEALDQLAIASGVLTKRVLNKPLAQDVLAAIIAARSGKWKVGKSRLTLLREDWATGRGYEMKFLIK